jgi:transcriptional regulator with XRE-family HTH domain
MNNVRVLEKLKNQSVKDDKWLNEAQWRQDNEAWLDISFAIAVKILRTLRERNMTQKDLAELLGLTPQYVNKIVKGAENLSLETISKIGNALNISLIEVPGFSFYQPYEPAAFVPKWVDFHKPVILSAEQVELDQPEEICCEPTLQAA